MVMTIVGWALGAIFIAFVAVTVYRLSSFIPTKPKPQAEPKPPKQPEQPKPPYQGGN